ncbi:MAG: ATP-binding protein [bacterium]|nr:ATP-binding protein [bacterium]
MMDSREGENLEFKAARSNFNFETLAHYCAALANEGGGHIVFGITDERPRRVVGTRAFLQPERTRNGLDERLHLRINFSEVRHPDGRVLIFHVPPRPVGAAIQDKGTYWMRRGDSLVPMSEDRLRKIFSESGHDLSADLCPDASFLDLDVQAIEDFRRRWIAKSGNQSLETLSIEQLLGDAELLIDGQPTFAALILFGTSRVLGRHLGQVEVVFEYRSSEASGPAQQRKEFRQGFFSFYDELWRLINLRNDLQHYQDGLFVLDIPTFDERIFQEESVPENLRGNLSRLIENGVIEQVGRGRGVRYVLSRQFYEFLGKKGVYTRKRGLDRETNKALLLRHISDQNKEGSRFQDLRQVLPALSVGQIKALLRELKKENKIHSIGVTRAGLWYLGPEYERLDQE